MKELKNIIREALMEALDNDELFSAIRAEAANALDYRSIASHLLEYVDTEEIVVDILADDL